MILFQKIFNVKMKLKHIILEKTIILSLHIRRFKDKLTNFINAAFKRLAQIQSKHIIKRFKLLYNYSQLLKTYKVLR
jgi:hypothetical protein